MNSLLFKGRVVSCTRLFVLRTFRFYLQKLLLLYQKFHTQSTKSFLTTRSKKFLQIEVEVDLYLKELHMCDILKSKLINKIKTRITRAIIVSIDNAGKCWDLLSRYL